ncbi:hypothetical protein LTR47_011590 [Exophiala xenobiotica]|nr:hypothetical protein LTR41_010628 [Exophiala xenobiotica]KAK5219273.1 hypothetical protein LTR47_011590 [Exophiala xenobiotica]KAK5251321.1 hypothetical protein LTS06_004078 [Exophiala xenobiotica]KAK5259621.1 hypothetical protein LTR40_005625 [Exophiala xenobiotica]KAK5350807.1 hypothetical protein LTR61_006005 [Exophiala xenobiotica]
MADKIPTISESALTNNGSRTVIHAVLAPGATTFPPHHTLFSEKFTLLAGSITVYTSPDMTEESFQAKALEIGESAIVPAGQLHNFLVGDEETTNEVTFEPGNCDFERAILIMKGTQGDDIYQQHGDLTPENVIYMAVMSELLNATALGQTKELLDGLYKTKGAEIEALKWKLVQKYASAERMWEGVR